MADLPSLTYTRPSSLAGALEALARPGAHVYAGGTDLIVALKNRATWVASVRELVDVKDVEEAMGIRDVGEELRIGALVTAAEVRVDPLASRFAVPLVEAASATSAPALRARGTVGGSLVTPHPAGDIATALLALAATIDVATSPSERRTIPLEDFLRDGPGALPPGALVVAVRFPKSDGGAFEKRGLRSAFTRSRVAIALGLCRGRTRVALAGLGPCPFVASETGSAIDRGSDLSVALARDCATFDPSDGMELRSLTEALAARACARLFHGT